MKRAQALTCLAAVLLPAAYLRPLAAPPRGKRQRHQPPGVVRSGGGDRHRHHTTTITLTSIVP